jgi:hypothetical protein
MVLSTQLLLLLIPFVVFLVLAIIAGEPRSSDFCPRISGGNF